MGRCQRIDDLANHINGNIDFVAKECALRGCKSFQYDNDQEKGFFCKEYYRQSDANINSFHCRLPIQGRLIIWIVAKMILFSSFILYSNCVYKFSFTAIDCTWGTWTGWEACSVSCGGGTQSRIRPKTVYEVNGGTCDGQSIETRQCNSDVCSRKRYSTKYVNNSFREILWKSKVKK